MAQDAPHPSDDYVLLPSVKNPGGREKAFTDSFKALVRVMIEVLNNPTIAYAIDKTDRLVTETNVDQLTEEDLDEWASTCAEFESMSRDEQEKWIEHVLASYPKMENLSDLQAYNLIN